jgi:hypothetical protein
MHGVTESLAAKSYDVHATHSSPPPCGEGMGVGLQQ